MHREKLSQFCNSGIRRCSSIHNLLYTAFWRNDVYRKGIVIALVVLFGLGLSTSASVEAQAPADPKIKFICVADHKAYFALLTKFLKLKYEDLGYGSVRVKLSIKRYQKVVSEEVPLSQVISGIPSDRDPMGNSEGLGSERQVKVSNSFLYGISSGEDIEEEGRATVQCSVPYEVLPTIRGVTSSGENVTIVNPPLDQFTKGRNFYVPGVLVPRL